MLKNLNTQGEIQAVTPSTAATQTPGKCLVSRNVCSLSDLVGRGVHMHPHLCTSIYSSYKKFAECGFAQHTVVTLDKGSMSVMYNESQRQPVYDTNTGVYSVKLGEESHHTV